MFVMTSTQSLATPSADKYLGRQQHTNKCPKDISIKVWKTILDIKKRYEGHYRINDWDERGRDLRWHDQLIREDG